MDKSIEQMETLEVYSRGLDLLAFIINNHTGTKRQMTKQLNVAIEVIRMTGFKKSFPEFAALVKDGLDSLIGGVPSSEVQE